MPHIRLTLDLSRIDARPGAKEAEVKARARKPRPAGEQMKPVELARHLAADHGQGGSYLADLKPEQLLHQHQHGGAADHEHEAGALGGSPRHRHGPGEFPMGRHGDELAHMQQMHSRQIQGGLPGPGMPSSAQTSALHASMHGPGGKGAKQDDGDEGGEAPESPEAEASEESAEHVHPLLAGGWLIHGHARDRAGHRHGGMGRASSPHPLEAKGEGPGHPFRGNQYGSVRGMSESELFGHMLEHHGGPSSRPYYTGMTHGQLVDAHRHSGAPDAGHEHAHLAGPAPKDHEGLYGHLVDDHNFDRRSLRTASVFERYNDYSAQGLRNIHADTHSGKIGRVGGPVDMYPPDHVHGRAGKGAHGADAKGDRVGHDFHGNQYRQGSEAAAAHVADAGRGGPAGTASHLAREHGVDNPTSRFGQYGHELRTAHADMHGVRGHDAVPAADRLGLGQQGGHDEVVRQARAQGFSVRPEPGQSHMGRPVSVERNPDHGNLELWRHDGAGASTLIGHLEKE